jgi:hypothetical protein
MSPCSPAAGSILCARLRAVSFPDVSFAAAFGDVRSAVAAARRSPPRGFDAGSAAISTGALRRRPDGVLRAPSPLRDLRRPPSCALCCGSPVGALRASHALFGGLAEASQRCASFALLVGGDLMKPSVRRASSSSVLPWIPPVKGTSGQEL